MDEKALFDGKEFQLGDDTWVAEVENEPGASAQGTDIRIFELALRNTNRDTEPRRLRLLASHAGIQVENHASMLYQGVHDFLSTGQQAGEIQLF